MTDDIEREASCVCGALRVRTRGEPKLVSSCCCTACQRRTGSFFGVTCFFANTQISDISGPETVFRRRGDSGRELTHHFCSNCGTTLYWTREGQPGLTSVAGGAFADPGLPGPERMVWTENRHPWICTPDGLPQFPHSPP
jgi:hypothetical protein